MHRKSALLLWCFMHWNYGVLRVFVFRNKVVDVCKCSLVAIVPAFPTFPISFFSEEKKAVVFTYEGLGLYLIRQKLNFNSAYLNYYLFIYIYLFFMVQLFEYNETLVPLQKLKI